MAYSKGSVNLIKPNEGLNVRAGGLKTFVLRMLQLAGNLPRKRLGVHPTTYVGVIPVTRRRLELEAHRATAYENFRRSQIR